ncbi:MAG: Fe-S cluster assembly protein SufD [Caulobacter sp.]|nr:Fe-S cluster assembly protein SufD [Caulobacter sp.]
MSLATAIATGDLTQLPSRRDEDWRWTDLRGLIRAIPPASGLLEPTPGGPFAGLGGEEIVFGNGRSDGRAGALFTAEGGAPLRLRFCSDARGARHASTMVINAPGGERLTLLESYEGQGDYLADVELHIEIEAGAHVTRVVLVEEPAESILVSTAHVRLQPGASFHQVVLTSGGRRQRIETRVTQAQGGAEVRMDGVYILRDQRHADLTTVVTHGGRDGTTSQLTKGVVRDQARGVFQGRIVVEKGADGTEARMGHHALILSDKAEVDAKPELLIFADDVQCAHGNTIGALDEAAIFYARQRGMPEDVARAMLTEAFVGEVVDRIEHEGARDVARAWVSAQLGASE